MPKKLKHDRFVEDLCSQIKADYDEIHTNVEIFSEKRRRVAEIDILAEKNGRYDIYEVKCSHRIIKAKKQLKKIKRLVPKISNLFFFCGESGCLEKIVV